MYGYIVHILHFRGNVFKVHGTARVKKQSYYEIKEN